MQHVDGFPEDLTVATPRAVVRVDGRAVDVTSLGLDSEIGSAMPAQSAAAGGDIIATTGDLVTLPEADSHRVSDGGPWGVGFDTRGEVTIDVGYDGTLVRQFTGRVDGVNGSPLRGDRAVQLIDSVDVLGQRVTIPPLLSAMPRRLTSQTGYRLVSLSPLYITDRVLRECGFYATPQARGQCVFSAPMMGSSWPEIGEVDVSLGHTDPEDRGPHHVGTHWGLGVRNAQVEWLPDLSNWSGRLDRTFQMITVVGYRSNATASARWTCWWGDYGVRVQVDSARQVYARLMQGETILDSVALAPSLIEDADVFTARVTDDGQLQLLASNGETASLNISVPSAMRTTNMSRVEFTANQYTIAIGGLQASFSSWNGHLIPRNAHLSNSQFQNNIWATPAFNAVPARDILKQQAEAGVEAMWIDEYGHFRWMGRHELEGTTPVGILTSAEHLLDLPWEYPVKSEFSRVEVSSKFPIRSYSRRTALTVWQGSNQSMDTGDEHTDIINVPSEEDWIAVDPPTRFAAAPLADVRRGRGSLYGGVLTRDDEQEDYATGSQLYQTFRRINHSTFVIESRANPPAGWTVEQKFLDRSYGRFNDENLPILRAKAKVDWDDRQHTGALRGPSGRPVLEHDVGPWIQREEEVQAMADWLAERVTRSQPILRDVPIVPDPRIQRGDVYWLHDDDAYQVRLRVLIMGISLRFEAGPPAKLSQTITCRVINAQRTGTTLTEHDRVWEDATLTVHDAYWSDSTLAEHDADPLRRD